MLADMTASSGQYANNPEDFDVVTTTNNYSIFQPFRGITPYKGKQYLDEFGNETKILNDNGQMVYPKDLDPEQFARKFKDSWAEALLIEHPEFCKLELLESFKASLEWNVRFENTPTYAQALANGYLTPFTVGVDQDPLAAATTGNLLAVKNSLQSKLNSYVSGTSEGVTAFLSMEEMAVKGVSCDQADFECLNDFDTNKKHFSDLCAGEQEMAWKLFKSLYLSTKRELIYNSINTSSTCSITPASLFAIQKMPRFVSSQDLTQTNQDGLKYWNELSSSSNKTIMNDSIAVRMDSAYSKNCQAYAKMWFNDLKKCVEYDSADIVDEIIPALVEVCKSGSDANHPFGSRERPDGYSFDDVINAYNASHSIEKDEFCNADVLSAPGGFSIKPPLTNQQVYTKPDSCTCSTITARHNEYLLYAPGSYSSFSNFMKEKHNAEISDADLTTLLELCNGTSVCRYIAAPVVLPPALQCGSDAGCKTCSEVGAVYAQFDTTYDFEPTREEVDEVHQRRNKLFENFMNSRLGLNKSTIEYLDFRDTCSAIGSFSNLTYNAGTSNCVSCDSLQKLVNLYFDTLNANAGSESQMLIFIRDTLNKKGLVTDTLTIKNALNNCNNSWQNNVAFNSKDILVFRGEDWVTPGESPYPKPKNLGIGKDGANCSIEFWAKPNKLVNTQTFLSLGGNTDGSYDFAKPFNTGTFRGYLSVLQDGQLYFGVGGVPISTPINRCLSLRIRTIDTISKDQWHHIVLTRTGSGKNVSDLHIFVDNQRMNTEVVLGCDTVANGNIAPDSCRGLFIFAGNISGGSNDPVPFMRNLRLYNRALDSAEISYNYFQCDGLPYSQDSIRLWAKFNEGKGRAKDYSSYNTPVRYLNEASLGFDTIVINKRAWTGTKGPVSPSTCAIHLDNALCKYITKDSLLLCSNESYPQVEIKTPDICSDSAFFAISDGTNRFSKFSDSLEGEFDSAYMAKCLQAYKYESFTVTHSVSEYHYTLYYYDQAGNLVKTVPPADVHPNRTTGWLADVKTSRAQKIQLVPLRKQATDYRYNSLNQVVKQTTPDAGLSEFFYDRLGRLVVSKNRKQAVSNKYSYTKYDELGRITEVGELTSSAAMSFAVSKDITALKNWMTDPTTAASRKEITLTTYDTVYPVSLVPYLTQRNLRNRVSWTAVYATATARENIVDQTSATFYSYDIHGNVDTLLQDYAIGSMQQSGNRFKKIVYDYDLISGKVNMVSYQPDKIDAFYHKYSYDAENRLTDVYTSANKIHWEHDAYYEYYRHGPLGRMVLGQQQVQGVDYAYTLQGWLKGINSTALTPAGDMGSDGDAGKTVARDAFGFALHYFGPDDYKPVSSTKTVFASGYNNSGADFKPLFNGNIAAISNSLRFGNNVPAKPLLYQYTYDQLNRLVGMQAETGLDTTTNTWTPVKTNDYKEAVTYDANGNIITYDRNGAANVNGIAMDALKYKYYYIDQSGNRQSYNPASPPAANTVKTYTNQLAYIDDISSSYTDDIDAQASGNYVYDEIGNLIKDNAENIDEIQWTVYGKIKRIVKKQSGTVISQIDYTYDAAGNRISKIVGNKETWYVRDGSGNVMGVYTKDAGINNGHLTLDEVHLYGSSRLGMIKASIDVTQNYIPPANGGKYFLTFTRGKKFFELSNHLGNVLASVSDKKIGVAKASPNQNQVSYYLPHIVNANDYYPFGMQMPGRTYSGSPYRYGFNGKEKDSETYGEGNQYDYGFRIYNPRIGRFLSVDPLTPKYPMLSTYQFASNTPIGSIDLDGLESFAVYNKATSQLYLIPDISQYNPQLKLKFVSASEYKNLTADDKSKSNYGILVDNVFTGGHSDNGQIVHNDPNRPKEKPISTGSYNILENKGNTNPDHNSFFVLDPQDSSPYDKVDDRKGELNSDGEKRSGYNLHPGRVSWGCVTICKDDPNMTPQERAEEWTIINEAINDTKTEQVPDNRGKQKYIPFSTQTKFGKLVVIDTKKRVNIKITVPKTQSKPAPTPTTATPSVSGQ